MWKHELAPSGRKNGRRTVRTSTALHFYSSSPHKGRVGLAPARQSLSRTKPLVRRFFKYLPQDGPEHANHSHPRSSANRVMTNGVSVVAEALRPDNAPTHCRTDSVSRSATIKIRIPVTTASRRLLKISRALPPAAAS